MRRLLPLIVFASCQSYQFEPVQPVTLAVSESTFDLAPVLKPNVLLTVDRSGSMLTKIDAACQGASCATRMSDLKQAVATFTSLADDRLRLALTVFPRAPITETGAEGQCLPANALSVDLPPASRLDDPQASQANRAGAAAVNQAVQALDASGGTPTGGTLAFVAGLPGVQADDFRNDFVLLLTDGLPNCNAQNPHDFVQDAATCRCQSGTGDCTDVNLRRRGCLDADATVAQVAALRSRNVRTIVVGFGADTTQGDAPEVLARLARAGDVPRTCSTNAQCGAGDQCTNGQCGRWSWQASNRAELEQVLATVLMGLTPATCVRELPDKPFTPGAVSLLVDGVAVPRGPDTWQLVSNDRQLALAPAFCEAHHGSTLKLRVAGSP